jgi:hypothetical protein
MIGFSQGQTIRIKLKDEMLMLLLRGGTVNYIENGVQIRIEQENDLVIIKREEYRELKRNINSPGMLEYLFRKIDK